MYFEVAYESRKWSIDRTTTSQTIVYYICRDSIVTTGLDTTYGAFFTPNDDVAVANFIYANFPDTRTFPTPNGDVVLYINEISAVEEVDNGWTVTITYSPPEAEDRGGGYVQFGFSTNGETVHTNKGISQRSIVTPTGSGLIPPATYNHIGQSANGWEGMDITSSGLSFNITGYFSPIIWSTSIMLTYTALSKRYNDDVFYGFPAGEVLLDYVDAQGEAFKYVPVTFYFIHQPNIVAVADAPFSALTMLGHDIADYGFLKSVSNSQPIMRPVYRQVLQVRYPGNFDLLGI